MSSPFTYDYAELEQYGIELTPEELDALLNIPLSELQSSVMATASDLPSFPDDHATQNPGEPRPELLEAILQPAPQAPPVPSPRAYSPRFSHRPTESEIRRTSSFVPRIAQELIYWEYRALIPPTTPPFLPGSINSRTTTCDHCYFTRTSCSRNPIYRCDACTDADKECSYWMAAGHPYLPPRYLAPYARATEKCEYCRNRKVRVCRGRPCGTCVEIGLICQESYMARNNTELYNDSGDQNKS